MTAPAPDHQILRPPFAVTSTHAGRDADVGP